MQHRGIQHRLLHSCSELRRIWSPEKILRTTEVEEWAEEKWGRGQNMAVAVAREQTEEEATICVINLCVCVCIVPATKPTR
jgi:hypothetical protein